MDPWNYKDYSYSIQTTEGYTPWVDYTMKAKRSQITVIKIKAKFGVKNYLFCSLVEDSTALSEKFSLDFDFGLDMVS